MTRPLGCAALQVAVEGPAEAPVRRGPVEGEAYSFAYSTKTPGTYTISATAAGRHMDGSPATVTASIAEAHAPLCEVAGAPLRLSTTAGEPCITLPCAATTLFPPASHSVLSSTM